MPAPHVISTVQGVEVPAPGTWTIRHGDASVVGRRRATLRRRRWGRVTRVTGALDVEGDHLSLVLTADVLEVAGSRRSEPPSGDARRRVALRADRIVPTGHGAWRAPGELELGDERLVADVTVTYHGVYRSAGLHRAWLVVRATTNPTGRRAASVDLVADVLATAPSVGDRCEPRAA